MSETNKETRKPFTERLEAIVDEMLPDLRKQMFEGAMEIIKAQSPDLMDEEIIEACRVDAMDATTEQGQAIDEQARLAALRWAMCLEVDALHARIDKLEAQP